MTTIGRPVRITSTDFAPGRMLAEVLALVDQQGALGADLIILPETFMGRHTDNSSMEPLTGPIARSVHNVARQPETGAVQS